MYYLAPRILHTHAYTSRIPFAASSTLRAAALTTQRPEKLARLAGGRLLAGGRHIADSKEVATWELLLGLKRTD